jgi:SAM-dependent methyltransferase
MSRQQTIYDDSHFYDLVHGEYAAPETLVFYEKQIDLYGSPVLELACGTGHYLIPLAEKGIDISGIDISGEMLERANQKAFKRNVSINVRKGDIRDFKIDRKFSLILLLGNSLQHLTTRKDVEKCFDAVKKHLMPNGRFIVEVFNPSLKILSRDSDENVLDSVYETDKGKMILTGKVNYDEAAQINHITWNYQNVLTGESKEFSFTMRQFFPQELDALLHYNGFHIGEQFGDRNGKKFESSSPRQIVVVNKAT